MKKVLWVVLMFFCLSIGIAQSDWRLAKEKDEVKIYTREKENSQLKEFKAYMICDISPEKIIYELEKNVANHTKWLTDVSEAKTLRQDVDKQFNYYKLDMPWPATDRDMVLEAKKNKIENGYRVEMKSAFAFSEPKKDVIRIKKTGGYWIITKNAQGKTEVEYMFFADPEGSLPTWVVNMFIVDGPLKSIQNLKEVLK